MTKYHWAGSKTMRRELRYANNEAGIAGARVATLEHCVLSGAWVVRANKLSGPVYVASEAAAERTALELATSSLIVEAVEQAFGSMKRIDSTVSPEDVADAHRRCLEGLFGYTANVLRAMVLFASSLGGEGGMHAEG